MMAHCTRDKGVMAQARPSVGKAEPSGNQPGWGAAPQHGCRMFVSVTRSLCGLARKGLPQKPRKLLGKHTYPLS